MFTGTTYTDLNFVYKLKTKTCLAFAGKRKTGKSFCSKIVVDETDGAFRQKAFADILKALFAEARGIAVSLLSDNKAKEQYREDVIDFSWKFKRDKGLFVFAESFFNEITEGELIVCDDIRIIEELQMLCMFGGVCYKVHADDNVRAKRGWVFNTEVDNELSETELGNLSAETFLICTGGGVIYNNKDENSLKEQLRKILSIHFPPESEKPFAGDTSSFNKLMDLQL